MPTSNEMLTVQVEFGGGTELLTAPPHKKRQTLEIPAFPSDASAGTGSDSGMKPAVTSPSGVSQNVSAKSNDRRPADMAYLIGHIAKHLLVERHELFVDASGTTVRPGILVLINDADWELEGENSYVLQDGDEVSFISTLHGG